MTTAASIPLVRILVASAALALPLAFPDAARAMPQAAGDFDNDGISDVAVGVEGERVGSQNAAGAVQIIFGTNNGLRFGNDALINQASAGSSDEAETGDRFGRVVAVGDFNDDGFDDLAVGVPLEDVSNDDNAGAVHVFYGSANGPVTTDDEIWTQNSNGLNADAADDELFGAALAVGDFDNDGFDDLAIGAPSESPSDIQENAGAVFVLYGSNGGLDDSGSDLWTQNAGAILDIAEPNDFFGTALVAGDFDNDGFDDLAIGVPGESVGVIQQAGGVHALFGSAVGLTAAGNQFWTQNSANIDDASEIGDRFGQSLAAGDFNGDLRDDLAIGVPNENIADLVGAGAVNVLMGSLNGLASVGDMFLAQATPGVKEASEAGDAFGFALAAGDFNSDGFADLAIGVPNESVGAVGGAGSVNVVYGGGSGLDTPGNQLWRQVGGPMKDHSEAGDAFGEALCVGDFNNDGFDDLIVGVPNENIGAIADAGAIHVIYGSDTGLIAAGNQFISQNTQNAQGAARTNDRFGGQSMNLF